MQIKNSDRSGLLCSFVLCSPPHPPPFSLPGDMHPIPLRILLLLLAFPSLVIAMDFRWCILDWRLLTNATGVDHQGRPVEAEFAVGLTYKTCTEHCGRGVKTTYNWNEFIFLSSAWVLPWLALLSRLPFSSANNRDDFISGQLLFLRHRLLCSSWYTLIHDQLS